MIRLQGYSTTLLGADVQSLNTAENTFLPIRVFGSTATLATSSAANSVVVAGPGTTVNGPLTVTNPAAGIALSVAGTVNTKLQVVSSTMTGTAFPILEFSHAGNDTFTIEAGNGMRFLQSGTTERMRIATAGNVLIGTTTDDGVNKLQVNGGVRAQSINAFGSAVSFNSVGGLLMYYNGSGVGVLRAYTDVNGTAGSLTFATSAGEIGRFDSSGNFLVAALAYGSGSASFSNAGFRIGDTLQTQGASLSSYNSANAAATCLKIGSMTTGRSISTVGTINASGADYAEYMVKASGVGDIAKGAVVGINEHGEVTDRWIDAVSFAVKTTNPSLVGGDTWGSGLEGDELEAARAKVDRIAFAGQVPVNVYGATPGQIILPARFGDKVGGVAVDASTLSMVQYMRAVGTVQNILPDGRANIRVKVA